MADGAIVPTASATPRHEVHAYQKALQRTKARSAVIALAREDIAPIPPVVTCRHCGCKHFRVVCTRPTSGGRIMRRRECRHCGKRLTAWERSVG